ncbi:histone-lysine N-methyltransferase SMYD3 isoform X1 [Phyllopteryx taeniolatus]|uniref:histone-lysine N-methyltransferase SMYD3 isoform X1 n=1 Tax=Phyllopteryx taeniolatus TaxID=161469 RepID=UPI002AD32387|nr:histone-lysine N-methyltransferase SMYD3 isoform X1 [Phyllopteryx taeniolatus]XP_061621809.1 histone-lysine N-methyltransferase SMYD3 isoform X1 [Phyllopteryx taeniolatus]XP_061621810.1 histone-lysine N-methyltransferase SMYD3 isoform X1 [Phyllopteryx taeniolatus]
MASMFERFVSPGKGNGLRATTAIKSGKLLFSSEPLASCVSTKVAKDVCHRCFARRETLLRCSQCKMARYCNITCQKQGWADHKKECKCLRIILPRIPTDSVRLAARLIFALLNPENSRSEELYSLDEHESHLICMSEQKKQGLSQLASMLELYLKEEVPELALEMTLPESCRQPLDLIAKVTCNCFTISDEELQAIGVGLYPSLSLLNHDCRPNCVMVFEGTKLHLRAVRDIKPAEELTISYIETLSLTEQRQKQLEDQYHFTCRCQKCDSQDTDTLMQSGEQATWYKFMEALPKLEGLKAASDWQTLLEGCTRLLSIEGSDVPDENLYKLRLTDMALDSTIHLGHWEEATRHGERTLPVYKHYYPDPHPVHGIQLMRVAKLQHYLERIKDALDTFKQAFEILKITHGIDHPLVAGLLVKMEECRFEIDQ